MFQLAAPLIPRNFTTARVRRSNNRKKKEMEITNYTPPPDAIIYEFNPHILIAVICLLAAFMIVLIRVLIDHADQAKGFHGKK
jgi:hypothetical protein